MPINSYLLVPRRVIYYIVPNSFIFTRFNDSFLSTPFLLLHIYMSSLPDFLAAAALQFQPPTRANRNPPMEGGRSSVDLTENQFSRDSRIENLTENQLSRDPRSRNGPENREFFIYLFQAVKFYFSMTSKL